MNISPIVHISFSLASIFAEVFISYNAVAIKTTELIRPIINNTSAPCICMILKQAPIIVMQSMPKKLVLSSVFMFIAPVL